MSSHRRVYLSMVVGGDMSSVISTNVWGNKSRGSSGAISERVFWLSVALWSTIGIATAAWTAYWSSGMAPSWSMHIGAMIVGIFGCVGVQMAADEDSYMVAAVCYFFIAAPVGFMVGPFVALYTPVSVFKILGVTSLLTVGLGLFGALFPRSMEGLRVWIFGALWVLIVAHLSVLIGVSIGITVEQSTLHAMDWIGLAIFAALIIYDFNRAARVVPTHTNALLVSVEIFLDFINVFVRLLSLFGKRSN